jgi:riboflavin biosynthesis pyrimidine reductase
VNDAPAGPPGASGVIDLAAFLSALVERGFDNILSEGGPHLLHDLLEAGTVDELCLTWVPRVIGGVHPRILDGVGLDVEMRLAVLLEDEGTLIGRWLVERDD